MTSKNNNKKLIVAVSSRTIFNLDESHKIYKKRGVKAYAEHQQKNENVVLKPGVGFNLVKKLISLNSKEAPIDVILLSRNSAETGLRIFNSIEEYNLNISKAVFTRGNKASPYITAFEADLFLSNNQEDVKKTLKSGFAAASIINTSNFKNSHHKQLRIAFDGDAVIFSDESEKIFQKKGLKAFNDNEATYANIELKAGPFKPFLKSLQKIQAKFPEEDNPIRTALVTARGSPSHKRVINTLRKWGIRIDEAFFLDGLDKTMFLKEFGADIFFDDRYQNCNSAAKYVPAGHVPNNIRKK